MANPRAAQLVEAGMWLRLSGDHEGAKRLFDQALKLDPGNERALQLLAGADAQPPAPGVPRAQPPTAAVVQPPAPAPPAQASAPFAAAPTSTAMDLDWGNATGFLPTPVPFIPPVELKAAAPQETLDVQVDLDAPEDPPPVLAAAVEAGPLVFGQGGGLDAVKAPGPFEDVPWDTPAAQPEVPSGGTMQFARPPAMPVQPPAAPLGGGTMQFARPTELPVPPLAAPLGGGTMQFARPTELPAPPPVAPIGGGTMQFARPTGLSAPPAEPELEIAELTVEEDVAADPPAPGQGGGTMQFALPAQPPAQSPAPAFELDFAHPADAQVSFPASGRTMAFGRPAEVAAPPRVSGGTMEFARFDANQADPDQVPIPPPLDPPPSDLWGDVSAALPVPPAPAPSEPKFAPNATSAWDQRSNPGIKISELHPGLGSALDLVSADRSAASPPAAMSKLDEVRTLVRGAKDLLGLDDHSGAMTLILKAQDLAPNDPEVQALRTRSEATLEAMFESKLGNLGLAPHVKLKDDEIIWLNLDHRAGFVLAQIDGQCTFEDLFSVSGMSRLDTARILAQLLEEGVITS